MSFQAYLDNIEQKTGKAPNEFIALAKAKGFDDPKTKAGWKRFKINNASFPEIFMLGKSSD